MSDVVQIRISGFGGQGIVLAGILLGQAGVLEGKYVTGSNSYGAQARGSVCKAEVVFSDNPIGFPHVLTADILAVMSQGGYQNYHSEVKTPGGLILYDQGLVRPDADSEVQQIGIAATNEALKHFKTQQSANLVMLGALIEISHLVSLQAIGKAIRLEIPERFRKTNLEALKIGLKLGKEIRG
jgi:2-oxoglutarate ferredoxin oxidoreductase subunit gamma